MLVSIEYLHRKVASPLHPLSPSPTLPISPSLPHPLKNLPHHHHRPIHHKPLHQRRIFHFLYIKPAGDCLYTVHSSFDQVFYNSGFEHGNVCGFVVLLLHKVIEVLYQAGFCEYAGTKTKELFGLRIEKAVNKLPGVGAE